MGFGLRELLQPGRALGGEPLRIDVLPVMLDEGLKVLVAHLALQPVERRALLKHEGGERVPRLFQVTVRNTSAPSY